jgi:hypothetical protein
MPAPSVVRVLVSAAALLCVARAGLHSMETDLFEDEEQRRLIEAINWVRAHCLAGTALILLSAR